MLLNFNMMKYVNSSMVGDKMSNATKRGDHFAGKRGHDLTKMKGNMKRQSKTIYGF